MKRFLQPRISSGINARHHRSMASHSPTATPSPGASFTFHQPATVVPISAVHTLPVHSVIDGLPVVTLPGIVAHEPIVMTAAQREFHERLRLKHLEIQKSIMAQQEELRRVETELLLAQYGAWATPTAVLKVKSFFLSFK